jgi:type III secretion system (T3SS) SseB-like protein
MTELTPLDLAHAAMEAAPDDDSARLRFFERLADGELFLLLAQEALGDQIKPQIFPVEGGDYVLVFDREDRLAEFVGAGAPYVALSGRLIADMLAGQGFGLGLNLGVAPSEILIPAPALSWLADTLGNAPEQVEARPVEASAPRGLPEDLLLVLDAKLALAAGLARFAWLAGMTYDDGRRGHMLAFVDEMPGARDTLAGLVSEALTFSGIDAGVLDVGFFTASDPFCAPLAKVGLRFDLPEPPKADCTSPAAPGMDPSKPPLLR